MINSDNEYTENQEITEISENTQNEEILEDAEQPEYSEHSDNSEHHHHHHHKHDSSDLKEKVSKDDNDGEDFWHNFIDWLEILSIALSVVILVFTFIFRVATIEGQSMEPTFYEHEKVVVSNLNYTPKYGDVVIISRNYKNDCTVTSTDRDEKPIIKRVIATEGQTVKIDFDEGVVYVDDKRLNEPYTATPTNRYFTEDDVKRFAKGVIVPDGCIFVLGDNRNNSLDSRSEIIGDRGDGMVNVKFIIGKVLFRIFPLNKFGGIK